MHNANTFASSGRQRQITPALGFLLSFVVILLGTIVSFWNITRVYTSLSAVAHTHEVSTGLQRLHSSLREVEASFRGFAITGENRFLESYQSDVAEAQRDLRLLRDLTSDNASQQERFSNLKPLIDEYLGAVRTGIDLRKAEGLEAARRFIMTDKPRFIMEKIDEELSVAQHTENGLLANRNQAAQTSYWTALGAGIVMVVLTVVTVAAAFYLVQQELAARLKAEEELRLAHTELENRIRVRTAELSRLNEALHQEVAERARAETAVRTQGEKLEIYARELERSNRELEQFAAVASHDLQEPLRKIQAFGDRLGTQFGKSLPEQGADYLARMLAAAARMRALIDDLLAYSRVMRKGRSFTKVDLGDVAREVVGDLEDRLQSTGGRVEIGALPTVEADRTQMRQLLQNLIANALKFRKPNLAPIVSVDSCCAGADGAATTCEISVRDNGIGFENEYHERIFNLFERLNGRNEYEGTGMGLAICRRIVERHGGVISAQSALGQGAQFHIRLPIHQPILGDAHE